MSASLSNIVDVSVEVSAVSTISSDFNLGLIIGKTKQSLTNTFKIYDYSTYKTTMVSDGYSATSDEYKAATLYFAQSPASRRVAIGQMKYTTVETVLTVESAEDAFVALRDMNDEFYSVCFASEITDPELLAVAAAVEASSIPTIFFYSTDDSNVLESETTNIFKSMKDYGYTRSIGFYSQNTLFAPAVMGLVSGLNSTDANSAYTLAYKQLSGIVAEDITNVQLDVLVSYNGNSYVKFGNTYSFIYPAISANGYHVDELYLVDVAKHLIQNSVVAGLISQRKIPQTEGGLTTIKSFISSACSSLADMGLISGGVWRGNPVMSLNTGDTVQGGYYIESALMSSQSDSDRSARKTPTIYVALVASGAIEHVVIKVYITR